MKGKSKLKSQNAKFKNNLIAGFTGCYLNGVYADFTKSVLASFPSSSLGRKELTGKSKLKMQNIRTI